MAEYKSYVLLEGHPGRNDEINNEGVMSPECKFLILLVSIVLVFAIVMLARWIGKRPVPPDPWENELGDETEDGIPVCTNCITPVENPNQHYCPKCGFVTGEYTRYIPFVSIPFDYSIFTTMWRKIADRKASPFEVILFTFLMFFVAPPMILVGLPFLICSFIKNRGR